MTIVCDVAVATLRVDLATAAPVSRTLELDVTAPKAHARLIALAAVELIATSASEQPVAPPNDATITATTGSTPRNDAQRSFRMLAFGGARAFDAGTGLLGGGGVRIMREGAILGWLADVELHHGQSDVPRGRVTTDVIDAAFALGAHVDWSRARFKLAVGLRGGWVRFAGTATEAMVRSDKFWAPWFGAFALGTVELRASRRVTLQLSVEGGHVMSGVGGLVDDKREVGIDGAWLGVHLGIGTIL